jgi:hypothetical protein
MLKPRRAHVCRSAAGIVLRGESLELRLPLSAAGLAAKGPNFQDVIVLLEPNANDARQLGQQIAAVHGGHVGHVYQSVPGFSASLPEAAIVALQNNPKVVSIEQDSTVFLQQQILPTGIDRAEADLNTLAAIDGNPGNSFSFPFRVATIDTGIDIDHPDLSIAGGRNFVRGANDNNFNDGNGHGTHVAGARIADGLRCLPRRIRENRPGSSARRPSASGFLHRRGVGGGEAGRRRRRGTVVP